MNETDLQMMESFRGLLSTSLMYGSVLGFVYWVLKPWTAFAIERLRGTMNSSTESEDKTVIPSPPVVSKPLNQVQ